MAEITYLITFKVLHLIGPAVSLITTLQENK